MFTVMTWNVENYFEPEPSAQANFDAKLAALAAVITAAGPDLLAVQEVGDERAFEALRASLGNGWTGALSRHFQASHAIRVGWLSPGPVTDVEEVIDLPAELSPVKVDDDGTSLTDLGRGARSHGDDCLRRSGTSVDGAHEVQAAELSRRPVQHQRRA
jgi:hypothetical protein